MPKLSIDVEGRIADYLDAIDKAELRTTKFARNIEGSIKAGFAGLLTALAAGFSAAALLNAFRATTDHMASLKDASDQTGASVEELSSLLNTLAPSGATIDEITRLTARLAQSMQEAEKGTGKAAAAFAALGVKTKDANGNLRPTVEMLDEVARRLNSYADGTNKIAIAQGLFGESGARSLGILRDLAETTRVAASVTTDQAEAADEFQKSMGRLNVELERFKVGIASDVIPTITRLISEFNEGREAAGGFWAAVFQFGTDSTDIGTNVRKYSDELEDLRGQLEKLDREEGSRDWTERQRQAIEQNRKNLEESIAQTERALNYYRSRQREAALIGSGGVLDANDARAAFRAPLPKAPGMDESKQGKERVSEAQRYIDSLNRQLALTGDLTEAEKLRNLQAAGLLEFESSAQRKRAQELAAEIDGAKERERLAKEQLELAKLIEQAEQRNAERIRETIQRYEDLADPIRVYKREIEEINRLVDQHGLSQHAAAVAAAEAWDKSVGATRGATDAIDEASDAAQEFGDAFESSFEKAIIEGEKLSEVLNGLIKDLARAGLRQLVTKPFLDSAMSFFEGGSRSSLGSTDLTQPQLDLPTAKSVSAPVINQNIHVDSRSDQASIRQAMVVAANSAKADILQSMQRNGAFAR